MAETLAKASETANKALSSLLFAIFGCSNVGKVEVER